MTTTSQEDDPKEATGSEPAATTPEASTDDKKVPLGELVKIRQEAARLREEKAALEARLAEAAKQKDQKPPPHTEDLGKAIRDLQRRDRLRDLQVEHDLTPKQADAVVDLMEKTPGLSTEEAMTVAASRDPQTFAAEGQSRGFQQGIHGTARPTSGPPALEPQGPDTEARLAHIKQLMSVNKDQAKLYLNNLVGSIAAQELGRTGHQRIPLPKPKQ